MVLEEQDHACEGLLTAEDKQEDVLLVDPISPVTSPRRGIALLAHILVFTIYTAVFLYSILHLRRPEVSRFNVYSPANEAVAFESHTWQPWRKSPYVGLPSNELEEAWDELLMYQNIGAPADEMDRLGRLKEGILLPDGRYLSSLFVFHQLHCLRGLHRALYADHYLPNMTQDERWRFNMHSEHCIDSLRQSIMCQGDTSMVTMLWGERQEIPLANLTGQHECVNWDRLQAWMRERHVDAFAPGVLVHPQFGPSYPGGKAADRIPAAIDKEVGS